jgi:hypothetical protein
MYFITAICNDSRSDYFRDTRCFGYYNTALEATTAVIENRGDLHECLYDYVVVEKIGEGIHAIPDTEFWFRWNEDMEAFNICEKPEWSNNIVNWAIG